MITSKDSPKVKYFDQLKEKKKRTAAGRFFIEGIHLVLEAQKLGLLDRVIYSAKILKTYEGKELLGKIISSGVPHEEASEGIIKYLSQVETPQGIIASARPRVADLGDLFEEGTPMIVVACGIQDPGNLGTLIRTADAANATGLVLSQGTVDPYNDKVIRASAGSIFHLNMVKVDGIIELISALKRRGIKVVSAIAGAEKRHFEIDYNGPLAVIIGSEGQGLPRDVENLSDEVVSIPMFGGAESLNAAVSGAVILYEALRQRWSSAGKTG